jgi:GDP-D-mannose dehydratase
VEGGGSASILPAMPTALVTGGAGNIGSYLCEYLLARDYRVLCVDNLDTGTLTNIEHIRDNGFTFRNHDLIDHLEIDEPIDVVYHLASPASPIDYQRLPLHTLKVGSYGTHNMLSAWRSSNGRASCSPPRARSTATRRSIPSRRRTGATSTRSARAASTTRRSGTRRR